MKTKRRAIRGVSRLLVATAAISGAATAYFADPTKGKARREEALRRLRHAANIAADRTQQWRQQVLEGGRTRIPQMTTIVLNRPKSDQEPARRTPDS